MAISRRAQNISPSPTLAITAKAKQMKAEGIDVISFGAGEPDFDTPENIKAAACKALGSGFTKYTATAGTLGLRQAICNKLKQDNALSYKPSQIIVSNGAKHSLYNAVMTLCDPGDEVIIPAPYWVTYPEQVKLAEGTPVFVKADENTGFKITPQMLLSAITDKTKVLMLNSPSNPTGAVYSRQELVAIAEIAIQKNLYVISDEIYEKMVYNGGRHVSIASLGDEIKKRTVVINGLSKSHSMTGWRIGYAAAEPQITAAMVHIQDHSASNPVSFSQSGAVEALLGSQESVKMMVEEFNKRRKVITAGLSAIPGIVCPEPGGAFYVFPNVSALFGKTAGGAVIEDADAFAAYLLGEARVAVVPGGGFGAPNNIRLSYATSMANIEKGIVRIAEAVGKLA
jgi:aspartate aminotransferase